VREGRQARAAGLAGGQPVLNAPHRLDITGEVCPMTYVRTKLKLESIPDGEVLEVLLQGKEPVRSVPRSATEEGHEVLSLLEVGGGVFRLLLRKKGRT
jgi:tRNA 2-thiouridine synthesizing protein A